MLKTIRNKVASLLRFIGIKVGSKFGFFAALYYILISHEFYGEVRAVLSGLDAYRKANKGLSEYMLIRNIHRIEKGLIMRPRKSTFARTYILDTVKVFAARVKHLTDQQLTNELWWAHDVLKEFFSVTTSAPELDKARTIFNAIGITKVRDHESKPYLRDLRDKPSININQMLELSKFRRSVRWYLDKPVPKEVIEMAIEVAGNSPTACNRQPYRFIAIQDANRIKEIGEIPAGTKGFLQNFPCLVVVIGYLDAYFHERDRHVIYIDASLAAMSFIYALEIQGVSSCVINWPDISANDKRIQSAMNLSIHERVVMLISIGYPEPDGKVPFSQKKPIAEILEFQ